MDCIGNFASKTKVAHYRHVGSLDNQKTRA